MEMDTAQIKGVDSTERLTKVKLGKGASIKVMERLMTHGEQRAESRFIVDLNGEDSGANIISRSVAKDDSYQMFQSVLNGNAKCSGHTECDAIIVGNAKISSIPEITANNSDAALIHEAAIGKIAGEQIIKLMTLGLTEEEAEEQMDAKETIRKMLQSKRKGEGAMEEKEKQRLYGFFMRKGFSSSEILSVFREISDKE